MNQETSNGKAGRLLPGAPGSARLWLCSGPCLSGDECPKPENDDEGDKVTAKNLITPETAAEIAVETSERQMSDGDEMSVWVWRPGNVASASEYLIRVSMSWSFSARPNDALSQAAIKKGHEHA